MSSIEGDWHCFFRYWQRFCCKPVSLTEGRNRKPVYSVFLSSYRNTRESLGELEKAVETLACGSCSHSISHSPKLPLVFLQKILDKNTAHVFYFLIKKQRNSNRYVPYSHLTILQSVVITESLACVAADSFPFSGGAEIEQANEKRASEGARLGWAKKLGRSREGVSKKEEGMGRKGTACL